MTLYFSGPLKRVKSSTWKTQVLQSPNVQQQGNHSFHKVCFQPCLLDFITEIPVLINQLLNKLLQCMKFEPLFAK